MPRALLQLAVALSCSLVIGCAPMVISPSPLGGLPPVLTIDSRGGPPVIVQIGSVEATRVGCSRGAIVKPGDPNVPPLPWDLQVITISDGRVLLSSRVTELPQWILLFGDEVSIGPTPVAGPAGPTCPPGS